MIVAVEMCSYEVSCELSVSNNDNCFICKLLMVAYKQL